MATAPPNPNEIQLVTIAHHPRDSEIADRLLKSLYSQGVTEVRLRPIAPTEDGSPYTVEGWRGLDELLSTQGIVVLLTSRALFLDDASFADVLSQLLRSGGVGVPNEQVEA
jgi:hypothetical protein